MLPNKNTIHGMCFSQELENEVNHTGQNNNPTESNQQITFIVHLVIEGKKKQKERKNKRKGMVIHIRD